MSSCAGKFTTSRRRGNDFIIESLDSTCTLLPSVAQQFSHLIEIAAFIPPVIDDIDIELVIGRDVITAHHILDQTLGEGNLPIGQKLSLGWVIIGQVCMTNLPRTDVVNVNKTFVLQNRRLSVFESCDSKFHIVNNPFLNTEHDKKTGFCNEDKTFLQVMESGFKIEKDGHWTAPLPFRHNRPFLPNNKALALKRAKSFDSNLRRDPVKVQHVLDFMDKIFARRHAEKAPAIPPDIECWYLPVFWVYHLKRPGSIRVVFDSSARYGGLSLNGVLLKGPDLSNSLQGILFRFRQNAVAITADVEQMFHNFRVDEPDCNYLRFIWHRENKFDKPLDKFRMRVHVLGNSSSRTVATYGLHRSIAGSETDVQDFVFRNFYVDGGLTSCENGQQAVSLMKLTQRALMEGGKLRLHKIASNSKSVLNQFEQEDLAKDLKNVEFSSDVMPARRTLGVTWEIEIDKITFQVSKEKKPLLTVCAILLDSSRQLHFKANYFYVK
jgi:hypothetical protein